jgi:hypothetical protein
MNQLEISVPLQPRSSAETLNRSCFCRTLNAEHLREHLEKDGDFEGGVERVMATHPHLFASTAVFLSNEVKQSIAAIVSAIERVIQLPAYQALALARAPAIAEDAFGPVGACMGFDFHLSSGRPKLIEINTNAGGALLNSALARAQEACCVAMDWAFTPQDALATLEQSFFDMFRAEWRSQRGETSPLRYVLIVDDDPASQYLAPEFELYRRLFMRFGVKASVADPAGLQWRDGRLWHEGAVVDMVYNRLTDFYLEEPRHEALRLAFQSGAVVLTPHPHAHALYADKRNLIVLSDDDLLRGMGASQEDRNLLKDTVPPTQLVSPERANELWDQRRQLFFKPVAGFGGRAAYRGDKLTKRVWGEILVGDFIAQALVPPAERLIEVDGVLTDLKFDIRAYAYRGQIQLMAARMYMGQTTNFRTEGGGFAPVIVVPVSAESS